MLLKIYSGQYPYHCLLLSVNEPVTFDLNYIGDALVKGDLLNRGCLISKYLTIY